MAEVQSRSINIWFQQDGQQLVRAALHQVPTGSALSDAALARVQKLGCKLEGSARALGGKCDVHLALMRPVAM